MAEAWADVDAWKQQRRAEAAEVEHAHEMVWRHRRQLRRERAIRANVERWFRQLPPLLVLTLISDATGLLSEDIGPLSAANGWLVDHGFVPRRHLPRRPATDSELALITALQGCRFPPASFSKRFARELDPARVTDGQVAQVRRLVTKFRRQISPTAIHEADRHLLSKSKK